VILAVLPDGSVQVTEEPTVVTIRAAVPPVVAAPVWDTYTRYEIPVPGVVVAAPPVW